MNVFRRSPLSLPTASSTADGRNEVYMCTSNAISECRQNVILLRNRNYINLFIVPPIHKKKVTVAKLYCQHINIYITIFAILAKYTSVMWEQLRGIKY